MDSINNLSLIFYENPIARAYLNIFIDKKYNNTHILYLGHYSKFELMRKYKFYKNNFYPINFLKDSSVLSFIADIEFFFNLRKNFLIEMYDYNNLKKFKNISFINTNSINSSQALSVLKLNVNKNYLISYQEILKDIFNINKNFFHIHPGYLPKVKGADGSLHSIIKYNELGATFFKMVRKIDEGPIIYRKTYDFKKFKLNNLKKFNDKDLYRIWFSFLDPALRCSILSDYLDNIFTLNDKVKFSNNENSNYYTFMKDNELSNTFKNIFFS